MIVKARAGTGGPALARYLEQGKNERAELLELRNLDAPSLKAALYRMDALAKGGHCQKHALHVQMRAAPGERLSASHWREAVDRYAEAFGLQEHQAAVILHHQPDGTTHCHAVFNRVHPETLRAVDIWQNYKTHNQLARDMERDWSLLRLGDRQQGRKDYSDRGRGEQEQAQRSGENVHAIRERIRQAWERAEDGAAFAQALQAEGFALARGDRRDFIAVDRHGNPYSLGQRTTGASAAQVREKLADLKAGQVPTLEEARARQHEAQQAREQPKTRPLKVAARPSRPGLPQRPGQPARPAPAPEVPRQGLPSRPAKPKPEPPPPPALAWNAQQEKRERAPRYYANDTIRRHVWEQAAAARLARMEARHTREVERDRRTMLEASAHLERGEAVRGFNDQQRQARTRARLQRQAEEIEAERQRQQARRDQWDAWAGRVVRAAERDEQRATLEAQRKAREEREGRYRGGLKTRLREDLTAMRQNPDNLGASNPRDPAPQAGNDNRPPDEARPKTRAELRREELQQAQGRERLRLRRPRKPEPF